MIKYYITNEGKELQKIGIKDLCSVWKCSKHNGKRHVNRGNVAKTAMDLYLVCASKYYILLEFSHKTSPMGCSELFYPKRF